MLPLLAKRLDDVVSERSGLAKQPSLKSKHDSQAFLPNACFITYLLLYSLALMNNTVRLTVFARRFLIRTCSLLSKAYFIRRPFIKQGLLLGISSGFLSLAIIMGGLTLLKSYSPEASISLTSSSLHFWDQD